MTKLTPRNLDHVVLPVPNLKVSRSRYESLGFTVAPDGQHSFGTENACVFFENGTYIEPLAIGHRETVEAARDKGNNFLRRDNGYRFRNGDDGFSMVVFGGKDAKQEKKDFRQAGYLTGKIVTVKRPGLKVRAIFAIDERAPDFTMFRCERPDGPPEFDEKLTGHANGALNISRIYLYEDEPSDFQYYIQTLSGIREIRSHSFGLDFTLPNATLSALNESGVSTLLGLDNVPTRRGMIALGFEITVKSLNELQSILSKNGISYRQLGEQLIVDPAEGQGAVITFKQLSTAK
ncbi:MAG: VOC family protein [Pseudomonadota bacterium]